MKHLGYLGMLAFCLLGTLPLEFRYRVRVYARWRRLALTILPVLPIFILWDLYAVDSGHWWFDPEQILGVILPGGLPIEELGFFLVIPLAAILTMEAVRVVRKLPAGDEP